MRKHVRKTGASAAAAAQAAHRATLKRGHERLQTAVPAYRTWHTWRYHKHVHYGVLVAVLAAGLLNVALYRSAFAVSDVTKLWDFSNQSEYTFSDVNALEFNGTSVRLKAQNYTSDGNTMALYHADNASGASLTDSSSNNNAVSLTSTTWGAGKLGGALQVNGTTSSARAADSSSLSLTQSNTLEGWLKLNSSFGAGSSAGRQTLLDKGPYKLYLDEQTGKAVYELQNSSATSWQQQAGNGVNGSWDSDGKNTAEASVGIGTDLYVGTGNSTAGDAEVWKQSAGGVWTRIGGASLNASWAANTFESVTSLATDGTNLYAGTGISSGDAEVWKWDGATWTRIGGDAINASWNVNTYNSVLSLNYFGGNLYAGTGNGTGAGEVWKFNGVSWSQIGGDGVGSSWAAAFKVNRLENDGTNLYAGTGNTAGMADVWRYNGSTWTQIGGDGLNSSWAASTYEEVLSSYYMGSNLYIGLGTSSGDGEVWRWSGSAWAKLASSGVGFPAATYEGVYSLSGDGTNLYAGTGTGAGDGDVWKYSGSSWSQIGGDGLNSGWTGATNVSTLAYVNSKLYANGVFGSSSAIPLSSFNGTSWTLEGGQYYKGSWGFNGFNSVKSMTTHQGKLYAGMVSAYGGAIVFEYNNGTWNQIGGNSTNGSWALGTFNAIESMTSYGGALVVGTTGTASGDAEVWSWDGSSWTKLGGDGANSSWNTSYSAIKSLATVNGMLYAGVGSTGNNGEVWKYESGSWLKIGGGGTNGSWNNVFRYITSMAVYDGQLVIGGTGSTTASAEVWKWDGSVWSKIGGDGVSSSWNTTTYLEVNALSSYQGVLYAGVGGSVGDGELWRFDGAIWTKVGGDGVGSSWDGTTHRRVNTITAYNGDLYVGTAGSAADGDIWKYDGTNWQQVGGDSVNSSWINTVTSVQSAVVYKGKLFTGLGDNVSVHPLVYSLGNNGYLESSVSSFDTNWRHFAATYDGFTMKLYINGQLDTTQAVLLTMPDSAAPLFLGAAQGSSRADAPNGVLGGSLDEVRISNIARTSFTTKPYSTSRVAVRLAAAAYTEGIASWDGLAANISADGGSVLFRLSLDGGTSWKYWDGAAWSSSADVSQASNVSDVNANIASLPVTLGGLVWQAVLQGNGEQRPQISSATLSATSDTTPPTQNATNVVMKVSPTGSLVADNAWTNAASPYFSWDAAVDSQSPIAGYCLYLGQSSSEDPLSSKGSLGVGTVDLTSTCPFAVASEEVNLATTGLLLTPLISSSNPYYLSIKAVDNAGNPIGSSVQYSFRYDNTVPSNPLFVSTPSQFVSNKQVSITWPTVGGDAASDSHSGIVGLQYRIGSGGTWYGDSHSGAQDMTDMLTNDGSYQTIDPTDFNNLSDGNNTIYFRSWDAAGNVSTAYVTGVIKINTSSPSLPQNLTTTPGTNTTNNFAFSWLAPASFGGSASNITYCYTINTLPSVNTCSYTAAGVTSLAAGAYATQPGANAIYVVAKDESGNINYAAYAQATFTANTSAPGLPLNLDIADISVKATLNWKLAVSWEQPTSIGAGVAQYRVYRSLDGVTYTQVASTSGTSYVDSGLDSIRYFYKVKACDSANNCGALTLSVDEKPTGKYTTAAELVSQPVVSDISTRRVTISWPTDRESDSRIQFGKSSGNYFTTEVASSQQTSAHSITINNLTSGTTYYARARWTDEDGNIGSSDEFSFSTSPAPTVKEVINKQVGLGNATVQFTTKEATKVKILYGKSEAFGGNAEVNTSTQESTYTTVLSSLEDGTKYFYKLNTYDSEDNEYEGNVYSLTTPARPRISNLRFEPVEGEPTSTQRVSWTTNVASTSEVTYSASGQPAIDKLDNQMVTEHSVVIQGLADDSVYGLVARSRDNQGNAAVSDTQTFRTALDTRPPKISDVVVKSAVRGSGSDARGQIIVSWRTDEPSTSQVSFGQGSQNGEFSSRTAEDAKLVTEHLVIISDLTPSKVYQVQALSKDRGGNQAKSLDQTTIVGKAPASIFDIVFKTLQSIFSFVK